MFICIFSAGIPGMLTQSSNFRYPIHDKFVHTSNSLFRMKLLSCLSLGTFLLVALIHLSNAAEEKSAAKKKLQIGVKKRVENCEQKSRRGDLLSMHYTVRFLLHFKGK